MVLDVSGDLPKSFVVCDHPYHRQIVYLSQLNPSTLKNRAESGKLELDVYKRQCARPWERRS